MTSNIRVQAGGQSYTFPATGPVRIGRSPEADVVLAGGSVSRQHASLVPGPQGWQLVDAGSSHGTWVNGQRVQAIPLTGQTTVTLGQGSDAATILVVQEGAEDRPVPHAPTINPAALPPTMVPNGSGAPGAQAPGMLVRSRAGDKRFGLMAPVRIGREPGLEITADDPSVSRQHALLEPRPDGWWLSDRSTSGTYIDGERVSQRKIEEPTTIMLGHPTAGYELELVPVVTAEMATKAIQGRKRKKAFGRVGLIAAALVLLIGGVTTAVVLSSGDDDPKKQDEAGLTEAELDRAKAASVFLVAVGADGQPTHTGSGSIISDDGLILTNAHVGKPSSPGQGASEFADPAYLLVALTQESDDKPAEPTYRAVPIVSDGYLDLAVLQIIEDADGNKVDQADLELPEPMPLGNSDELRTGDSITALGYPGIGNPQAGIDRPLTVTKGVVSTFQRDEVVGTERGYIDSDVRLGSGNSGGASINDDGELIGINTAVITAVSESAGAITQGSALLRPLNLADKVLEIARKGGDPDYVSPYAEELPDPQDVPSDVSGVGNGWTTDGQGGCVGTTSLDSPQTMSVAPEQTIYAEFTITGLPEGTPIGVGFVAPDGETQLGSVQDTWKFDPSRQCVSVPFTVPAGVNGANAVFFVGEGDVLAENPLLFQ
ncbi:FHA domain-containing protein [Nocardioides daejeonensis]|uniref:FHA domain-containing protein n=1 Tax=Nocardioides daejeonensis TaxID=1046556 RepID=UPI000D74AD74|nr:FHA domain-containing protein [Nocardioides daejeonensis]